MSEHAQKFNHDPIAGTYDADVVMENRPSRLGYNKVLEWVVDAAKISPMSTVLDLGVGTGNLSEKINSCLELVCVDISKEMMNIARPKLSHLQKVSFVQTDILGYLKTNERKFDRVISTYSIHHLNQDEKWILFEFVWNSLNENGLAVFGDLMVESSSALNSQAVKYRKDGDVFTARAIEEEFFWELEEDIESMRQIGFNVSWERFSDLSFTILASKA